MQICKSPFLIWFTGRTGSTYLCDLLNSHTTIYCRREDFSEIRVASSEYTQGPKIEINGSQFFRRLHRPQGDIEHPDQSQTVDYLHHLFSQEFTACGFKLKFPNQFLAFPEVVDAAHRIENLRLIGLYRNNVLKQAISLSNVERIRQLGVANSGNAKCAVNLQPLELNIDEALKHARFFARCKNELKKFASEFQNVFYVAYEDLCKQPDKTLNELLEFLQVDGDAKKMYSNFKKITPDRISDAISNYDQLVTAVNGTDLQLFLD